MISSVLEQAATVVESESSCTAATATLVQFSSFKESQVRVRLRVRVRVRGRVRVRVTVRVNLEAQLVAHLHRPQHVLERHAEQPCEVARRLVLARDQKVAAAFRLELAAASELEDALASFLARLRGAGCGVDRVAGVPQRLARLRRGQVRDVPCHREQGWFGTDRAVGEEAARLLRRPRRLVVSGARLPSQRRRFDRARHVAA